MSFISTRKVLPRIVLVSLRDPAVLADTRANTPSVAMRVHVGRQRPESSANIVVSAQARKNAVHRAQTARFCSLKQTTASKVMHGARRTRTVRA